MSSLYYKNQKYTGPTLDLGSGSLTTDDKTIVGAINELDAGLESLKRSIVVVSNFPTDWAQLMADAALGTIVISAVRDAGTAVGSPSSVAYSYGSLITIKGSYPFASLQIFVPDTNSASSDKIYMKTGGQWLAFQGMGISPVTT